MSDHINRIWEKYAREVLQVVEPGKADQVQEATFYAGAFGTFAVCTSPKLETEQAVQTRLEEVRAELYAYERRLLDEVRRELAKQKR